MTLYIFISIFFQLVFAIVLYQFGLSASQYSRQPYVACKSQSGGMDQNMWNAILFFTIIVSIRYSVGVDCESYVEGLKYISKGIFDENRVGSELEPLGILIAKVAIFWGNSRYVLLGIYGFLESFFIWYALKGRRWLLPYIGLTIILGPVWFALNNGLRQITVACLFTYAVQQLIDYKDWKKYFVLIFAGYFLHHSDLILLPFVFLMFYNILPNKWLLIGLQFVCVVLGSTTIMNHFFSQLDEYINFIGYSGYGDNLDYYVEQEGLVSHYGPRRIVMLVSYLLVMYKSKEMDVFYGHDKFYRVTILLATIYSCLTELFLGSFFLFSRPLTYFRIFVLISQSYLLYYFMAKKQFDLFVVALMATCSYVILDNIAYLGVHDETSIYKIYFFKDWY